MEFNSAAALKHEFETNLKNGGTFIPNETRLRERDECDIVLVHPNSSDTFVIQARAVWMAPGAAGAGVAFIGFSPETRDAIQRFILKSNDVTPESDDGPLASTAINAANEPAHPPVDAPILEAFAGGDGDNLSLHQKLRNLSPSEQHRVARGNIPSERIALERIYGKSVWEPLLQNPRLTIPEVARIARMGALPIPLVELIVNNASWISSPPVRRALLTNPRLGRDQIPRVLKTMPAQELKLVPKQMGYTAAVRETARRMIRS
ncbi:MAG: hypothetical protein JXX14_22560 [Deltaproteobacteria bacterium]|nr:hypothetical protein [Deltaproteobacteria bacterium]